MRSMRREESSERRREWTVWGGVQGSGFAGGKGCKGDGEECESEDCNDDNDQDVECSWESKDDNYHERDDYRRSSIYVLKPSTTPDPTVRARLRPV